MANNLTGDFEAVVEVSVRQINGLLATLHQSGVDEHASRPLLHSAVIRIGDVRRRPPIVGDFGNWVLEYQRARGPLGLGDLRNHLTVNAPPPDSSALMRPRSGFCGRTVRYAATTSARAPASSKASGK